MLTQLPILTSIIPTDEMTDSRSTSIITVPKFPADIPINLAALLQYGMVTGLPALSILPRQPRCEIDSR